MSPPAEYGLDFTQLSEGQPLFPPSFFATAQSGCVYIRPRPDYSPQAKIVDQQALPRNSDSWYFASRQSRLVIWSQQSQCCPISSFHCLLSECCPQVYILGQPGLYSTACMFTEAETQLLYKEQKKTLESCDSVCDGSVS